MSDKCHLTVEARGAVATYNLPLETVEALFWILDHAEKVAPLLHALPKLPQASEEGRRLMTPLLLGKGNINVEAGLDSKGAYIKWRYTWTERASAEEAICANEKANAT